MNEMYENEVIVDEETGEVIDLVEEEEIPEVEYYSTESNNGLGKALLVIGGVVVGATAAFVVKPVARKAKAKYEGWKESRKEKKELRRAEKAEPGMTIDKRETQKS